ncbi:hypothetical protein [Achromobacter marplatensis]|uniref:hypothetical protein n=1 Tax=Achromobacter marplatensis TaxID=470868 RepID=UPI0028EDB390|nr:hypothetical protein [Achromobacter marplatensis]
MIVCLTIFIVYVISVFVSGFAAFRINPSIRKWIEKSSLLTERSLRQLAYVSDESALAAFKKYIFGLAAVLFFLVVVLGQFITEPTRQVLSVGFVALLYIGSSIGAWSHNREEIVREFLEDAKTTSKKVAMGYSLLAALMLSFVIGVGLWAGELDLFNLSNLVRFLVFGFAAVVVAGILVRFFSVAFILVPAFIAISFLWLSIYVARSVLVVGKETLVNLFCAYCVLGTIYLALLSMPGLRIWLNIPAICQ